MLGPLEAVAAFAAPAAFAAEGTGVPAFLGVAWIAAIPVPPSAKPSAMQATTVARDGRSNPFILSSKGWGN
jgi:hypothetical protein